MLDRPERFPQWESLTVLSEQEVGVLWKVSQFTVTWQSPERSYARSVRQAVRHANRKETLHEFAVRRRARQDIRRPRDLGPRDPERRADPGPDLLNYARSTDVGVTLRSTPLIEYVVEVRPKLRGGV